MSDETEISVEEFVGQILRTSVAEAKYWVDKAAEHFPKGIWASYLKQGMTKDGLQWLMRVIPIQISISIRDLHFQKKDYGETRSHGDTFVKEILRKAEENGIDVTGLEISPIVAP